MRKYFIVPDEVVTANNGRVENDHGLQFVRDLLERWVINVGVAKYWPDIAWSTFETTWLGLDDFPVPEL